MGRGTKLWASPVWGGQDEGEPAKGTEEEWPGGRDREGAPPRGQVGKYSERLRNGSCDCYCQVRMEARVIISEAIKHFTTCHVPASLLRTVQTSSRKSSMNPEPQSLESG